MFESSIILTIDVNRVFSNITEQDGVEAVKEALEEKNNDEVIRDFALRLL